MNLLFEIVTEILDFLVDKLLYFCLGGFVHETVDKHLFLSLALKSLVEVV